MYLNFKNPALFPCRRPVDPPGFREGCTPGLWEYSLYILLLKVHEGQGRCRHHMLEQKGPEVIIRAWRQLDADCCCVNHGFLLHEGLGKESTWETSQRKCWVSKSESEPRWALQSGMWAASATKRSIPRTRQNQLHYSGCLGGMTAYAPPWMKEVFGLCGEKEEKEISKYLRFELKTRNLMQSWWNKGLAHLLKFDFRKMNKVACPHMWCCGYKYNGVAHVHPVSQLKEMTIKKTQHCRRSFRSGRD